MELFHNIIVTSSKGGIGKSTVSLGVASALAAAGKRVLLVDCDAGNRCLDLLLGVESNVLYDLQDVYTGRAEPRDALISVPFSEMLLFCAAPYRMPSDVPEKEICDALRKLRDAASADFVICDTSGSGPIVHAIASDFADGALIIATQQPASIRSAEKTAMLMDEFGKLPCRLVISCFDEKAAEEGVRSGLLAMIDSTHTQAIGVVPRDRQLMLSQEKGTPPPPKCRAATAFRSIARRICGEDVRLFSGMRGIRTNRIL